MKKHKKYLAQAIIMSMFLSSGVAFAEDGSMNPPQADVKVDLNTSAQLNGDLPLANPGIRGDIKDTRGDIKDIRKENVDLRKDNNGMREDFREEYKDKSQEDRKEGRKEMENKIKENRDQIKDNRDDIKSKKEELKNELHLKMQVRFGAMVDRLNKIAGRIQSRIDESKAAGQDTIKAQADLDIAIKAISDLKVKADAAVIIADDDQATKDANKATIDAIKALMKTAKDKLLIATYDLAQMKKA